MRNKRLDRTIETANPLASPADSSSAAEAMSGRLALRADLELIDRGGTDGGVIHDPIRGKYFRVGPREWSWLVQLKSQPEVNQLVSSVADDRETLEHLTQFFQWLVRSNLVAASSMQDVQRMESQAVAQRFRQRIRWLNPICFRIPIGPAGPVVQRLSGLHRWLFHRAAVVAWCLLAFWALTVLMTDWSRWSREGVGILSHYGWIKLTLVTIALKCFHEMAHGLACRRFGVQPGEFGILLLLFAPLPYIDVSNSWRLASRWQRLVIAAAGMYVELAVAAIAVIVWSVSTSVVVRELCYHVALSAGVMSILFNANPLMRFDGYYILSDLVGISNLYHKGYQWVANRLGRVVLGVPLTGPTCPPNERSIVVVYGCLAFLWRILVSVGLLIAASSLLFGAGLILAMSGAFFWFAMPLWNKLVSMRTLPEEVRPGAWRVGLGIATMLIAPALGMQWISMPTIQTAAVLVLPGEETWIRAPADGFVESVRVADGQIVRTGQPLLVMNNPELEVEIEHLHARVDSLRVQSRRYRNQREWNQAATIDAELESVVAELDERLEEQRLLVVRAPCDGIVLGRELDSMLGRYASRGTELCTVVAPDGCRLASLIDQRDWELISADGLSKATAFFPQLPPVECHTAEIQPRALTTTDLVGLTALAKGPLPIRPDGNADPSDAGNLQLLAPHFRVEWPIQRSDLPLQLGQRGIIRFERKRQPVAAWCVESVDRWLHRKWAIATHHRADYWR